MTVRQPISPFRRCFALVLLIALLAATRAPAAFAGAASSATDAATYLLIENAGQYPAAARFMLPLGSQTVWLTDRALWLAAPDAAGASTGTAVRFSFAGANPQARLEPSGRSDARVSYLTGADASAWRADAPVWTAARYRDLYPGIDLVVGEQNAGVIPWRLEARGGADPGAVRLQVDGAGATAEADGLRLALPGGALDVALPVWNEAGSAGARMVRATADGAGFALALTGAATGSDAPAAGDLIFNNSLGGSLADAGNAVAVDYLGNAYVTGDTDSNNFPTTTGAYDTSANGGTDAFVAKYSAAGALVYATYLGGSAFDAGWGIAVDINLAYVVGETASTNFPVIGGSVADTDIFVAALNGSGSALRYVTRIGGSDFDTASGIAVEGPNAYIAGNTASTNLNGTGCAGIASQDLVVAKLSPAGAPLYTTCIGGSDMEIGSAVAALDGVAYVAGESLSPDFPGGPAANNGDMLVAKLAANGTLNAAALFGGSGEDAGSGIALDQAGNIYVTGTTWSADFPVSTGTPAFGGGISDAAVVKLAPALTVSFAEYLGGADEDYGKGIAVDTVSAMYVTGSTLSGNFPTTGGAYDTSPNGNFDVFASRLHLNGATANKLTYSSFLGGANDDWGYGVDTDTAGHALLTGSNQASGSPISTAGFVGKLKTMSPPAAPALTITAAGANINLNWNSVSGATRYQALRNNRPYFIPGASSTFLTLPDDSATHVTDSGALGQPGAFFYLLKALNAAPAAGASSNRVGAFTFELVKGG